MFLKKLLKLHDIQITILKQWEKHERYPTPGVLIHIEHGKGLLKESFGSKDNFGYATLTIRGIPLLQFYGDEYFCPTCEKMVRSGYQLTHDEVFTFDAFNLPKENLPFLEAVNQLYPILGLLDSGYYVIHDTELYPTDGNAHLFWNYPNEDVPRTGSCPFYFGNGMFGYGTPTFAIATQSRTLCKEDRVSYYEQHPGARAIAYYMEGFLCALLDGHHKMLAAARNQSLCNALVIERCTIFQTRDTYYLNCTIQHQQNIEDFIITKEEYQSMMKQLNQRANHAEIDQTLQYFDTNKDSTKLISISQQKLDAFPQVVECAARTYIGDQFDSYTHALLTEEILPKDDLLYIYIQALPTLQDTKLCLRLCQQVLRFTSCKNLIYETIKVIGKLPRTDEIEQLLIKQYVAFEECSYITDKIASYL